MVYGLLHFSLLHYNAQWENVLPSPIEMCHLRAYRQDLSSPFLLYKDLLMGDSLSPVIMNGTTVHQKGAKTPWRTGGFLNFTAGCRAG